MKRMLVPDDVTRAVERMRPTLADLPMLDRFEAIGMLVVMESIDFDFTDDQLRDLFDSMRDRFVRSAWSYRVATRVRNMFRTMNKRVGKGVLSE